MLCEQCRVYEATMLIDDEWLCEVCTSGAVDIDEEYFDGDSTGDTGHDPDCPCDQCQEERIEVGTLYDMGLIP
jgi:hypothetical protein